ncbi:stage II sporulation protein R [Bacillus velezensis]|uniref:stage II sporulation protein R n=1 Tax=Bacillus amyloliquefaciens group TaxID=1938374 RepID=UPI000C8162DE|nr:MULTISPECIES: stage II sporulation protein R [Bacillus amyloliquefaciens group]MED4522993.1 stage II sporulation protein R [Bacillus velezensis]WFO87058.1 stage II sporulation protein R [Bacillus velezensis]
MKQTMMICIYIFLLLSGALAGLTKEETARASANEPVVIPDEAIRLRILANSDNDEDQKLKRQIRDAVNEQITDWVKDITSIEEARRLIRSKLPEIKEIAKQTMKEKGAHQSVSVQFNKISFPTKLYGNMVYPAGKYEAILITLGNGEGANWWCVLFPPLCFLDFSNGEAVKDQEDGGQKQEETQKQTEKVLDDVKAKADKAKKENKDDDDTEVKFFLVDWISDLFS